MITLKIEGDFCSFDIEPEHDAWDILDGMYQTSQL